MKNRNLWSSTQHWFGPLVWLAGLSWFAVAALAAPQAGAQEDIPTVGALTPGLTLDPVLGGLREGLARLGLQSDRNLRLLVNDTKGDIANLSDAVSRVLGQRPKALFTVSATPTLAVKQSGTSLPVVFAWVGDPLKMKLIASYNSPGSNFTGVSSYARGMIGKRMELLKAALPQVKKLFVLSNLEEETSREALELAQASAPKFGFQLVRRTVSNVADMETSLRALSKGSVDAIFHLNSALMLSQFDLILKHAKRAQLPVVASEESMVRRGALFSYAGDFRSVGMQAARLLAKVLMGQKPGEIPSEIPDRFLLALNGAVAKSLGLKLAQPFLSLVDRMVE